MTMFNWTLDINFSKFQEIHDLITKWGTHDNV